MNSIEELGVVITTALLQKNITTRDSWYIKEGFRLRVRFVEIGGGGTKKKMGKGEV